MSEEQKFNLLTSLFKLFLDVADYQPAMVLVKLSNRDVKTIQE